ncbi:MAG: penicillin-binding protein [Oscillospiraceae bacterium]|nr:penicillin-binding protein [Oscillospiraceae bacterium]
MKDKFVKPFRMALLAALPLLLGCVCILTLYNLQILNRDKYMSSAHDVHRVYSSVAAARGDITDRNGRLLATTADSHCLTLDRILLTSSPDPNGTLLELIDCVGSYGVPYSDTLPISLNSPFEYTSDTSVLDAYFEHFSLGEPSADELMAYFREHYSVPSDFTDRQARLAAGVRWELERRTLFGGPDYIFASDAGTDVISAVSERAFPGVSVVTIPVRKYVTESAAHVLGYIGPMNAEEYAVYGPLGYPMDAVVGKDGAEKLFEQFLRGEDGQRVTEYTDGKISASYYSSAPKAGATVALTLDLELQQTAERSLAAQIEKTNEERKAALKSGEEFIPAEGGAAVVVEVGSGDVLAMVSYPGYPAGSLIENYSALLSDPLSPLFNRATQGRYAPGSTFKMVTGTAALQEGVITPDEKIYDRGIITEYSGYTYTCWAYPGSHGYINVREALQHSCNYFFYTVGRELGIDVIDRYAEAYGLGQPSGIELYEDPGVLASAEYKRSAVGEDWYVGDTFQASIGQSYHLFTPLQLAGYAAAIASGGERYASHILSSIVPRGSKRALVTYAPELLSTVEADEEYFRVISEGMNMAAKYGSAAYVFGSYPIEVCAKTGTAQISADSENNAVFIAFAPFEDPEIAVAVVVEKGGSGSALAEVAADIFDCWFAGRSEDEAAR